MKFTSGSSTEAFQPLSDQAFTDKFLRITNYEKICATVKGRRSFVPMLLYSSMFERRLCITKFSYWILVMLLIIDSVQFSMY
jgi:hypothetical protein